MLKRLLASVLIVVFVALSINKVSHWHTHVSTSGVVYQHTHPYANGNQQKHSHSKTELCSLVLISDIFDDDTQFTYVPEAAVKVVSMTFIWEYIYSFVNEKLLSNKSPPFLLYS